MITKLKSLKNHKGFMKYFKNTSWLLAEKVLRMIVGLFVGLWIARYLGPEQFGLFSYAGAFVGLFTAISTLGLDGIIVRELVKDESKRDILLGTAFILKLIGALGVLLFLAIAVNFTSNDEYTNMLIFIIASATIFQSFNVVDFYFQSKVLSKYVVYANIISLLISSTIKVILILNEAPLIAFAWVVLFDSFILACGFIYFYYLHCHFEFVSESIIAQSRNALGVQSLKFSKSTAANLLKDSWPLILAGIAISFNMNIDQIMIREILGNESVGLYSAAIKIAIVFSIVPHLIVQSIFPSFVNAYKNDYQLFIARISRAYRNLFYISLFIAVVIFFSSDFIIFTTLGSEYMMSSNILRFTVISILFNSIGAINSMYLRVRNMQKKMMYRQWINVFSNIVLNFMFIHEFGVIGAVYATIIATVISTLIYDLFDKECRDMNKAKLSILFLRIK